MSQNELVLRDMSQNELVLRRDGDGIYVDHAAPVMWFAEHALNLIREQPDSDAGWAFDGTLVTLDVSNGRWVWKLTGKTQTYIDPALVTDGPAPTPLVMLEAVWPD